MRKDFGRNNDQRGKISAEKMINEETFWQKNLSTMKEFGRKNDQRGNISAEKSINEERLRQKN